MMEMLNARAKGVRRRYDRIFTKAKEVAWMTADLAHFRRRATVGSELAANARLRIPKDKGYVRFDASGFGGTQNIVAAGRAIHQRWIENPVETNATKSYFHSISNGDDLEKYPAIMEFALNRDLLSTLSDYYSFVPELCSVGLMLSTPAEKISGSQHGHFDTKDSKHIKVVIAVEDIHDENGPFEFIAADSSNVVREKSNGRWSYSGRFKDQSLFKVIPHSAFLKMTAAAGAGLIVDTSNCLHFGSRVERGFRLMWFLHYATFSEYDKMEVTQNGSQLMAHFANKAKFVTNELTQLVLNVRKN